MRSLLCCALGLLLVAGVPSAQANRSGSFSLSVQAGPYISDSRIPIQEQGASGPYRLALVGLGRIEGDEYVAPAITTEQRATIIGSLRGAVAIAHLRIVPAPAPSRPLLAVATYDDGIALHDPRTFKLIGYLETGGAASDVAFTRGGDLLVPDTDGTTLTRVTRRPWSLQRIAGVDEGNEVLVAPDGTAFISDRDRAGAGALTRVGSTDDVRAVATGMTAEGLSFDAVRHLVYVGNVNSGNVAVVDARSMRVLRTIRSVERTFGIAFGATSQRLFVVSNTSPGMNGRGGSVAAIDTRAAHPHVVARSAALVFPIGIALDAARGRVFVTDEAANVVDVLSTRTLHAIHAPLRTCKTPWRPAIVRTRLYIPCAQANRVDVFDLATLRRVPGAPFATGGFPLHVAVWAQ